MGYVICSVGFTWFGQKESIFWIVIAILGNDDRDLKKNRDSFYGIDIRIGNDIIIDAKIGIDAIFCIDTWKYRWTDRIFR